MKRNIRGKKCASWLLAMLMLAMAFVTHPMAAHAADIPSISVNNSISLSIEDGDTNYWKENTTASTYSLEEATDADVAEGEL